MYLKTCLSIKIPIQNETYLNYKSITVEVGKVTT